MKSVNDIIAWKNVLIGKEEEKDASVETESDAFLGGYIALGGIVMEAGRRGSCFAVNRRLLESFHVVFAGLWDLWSPLRRSCRTGRHCNKRIKVLLTHCYAGVKTSTVCPHACVLKGLFRCEQKGT